MMANFENALLWAVKMIFRISSAAALDEDFIVVQVRRHSPSLIRQLERSSPSSASLSTRQSMSFLRERLVELRARRPNQLFRTEAGDGRFYWRLTPPPPEPHGNHDDGCPASTDSLPPDAVRSRMAPVVQPTAGHKRQLQNDLQKMADQFQSCELAQEDDADAQAVTVEPAKKQRQILETDLSDIAENLQPPSRNEDSHTEHIASASSCRRSKERGPYRRRQRKARSESSKRLDRPLDSNIPSASKAGVSSVVVSSPSIPSPTSADSLPSPRPAFPRCSQAKSIKARLFRPALSRFDHHRPGTDGDAARLCRRRQAKARAESCNRLVTPPTAASNTDGKPDSSISGTASNQDAPMPTPPAPENIARRSPQPKPPGHSRAANLQDKRGVHPLPRYDHDSAVKDENYTRRRKAITKSLDLRDLNKSRRSFIRRPKEIVYKRGKSTDFATNVEPELVVFEGRRDVSDFDGDFVYPSSDVDIEAVDDSDIDSYPCLCSDEEENFCNAFGSIYIHDRR